MKTPRWRQDTEKSETSKEKETILIRDFRKSDLDDVVDLLPRCFAQEFEEEGFDSDHVREMAGRAFGITGRIFLGLSGLFGNVPFKFLVAEAKNKVVGTTIVSIQGKFGYISTVMVDPDYRRRGIATTLVKNAVAYIQKRGMNRAILHVVSTNTPAMDAYSKLGFKPFENMVHLIGDANTIAMQGGAGEIKTRIYENSDLNEVYNLIRASDDPDHLRIYEFSKKQLKTPFWEHLFHFATERRIVALLDGKIVGYVTAIYTTPKEVGNIGSLQVNPKDKSHDIEKLLVNAAISEIRKGGVERIRATVYTTKQELIEILNDLDLKESSEMIGMFKDTRE